MHFNDMANQFIKPTLPHTETISKYFSTNFLKFIVTKV